MSRFPVTPILALLLAPIVANGQPVPALWRFVHPNAKALISIDWSRVRDSQAGAAFRQGWLRSSSPSLAIPGMELLNDIDRILISSPANKTPQESAEPPVLIVIYGHFDPAKVHEVFTGFGTKPQAYNSFKVYRPQAKNVKDMACVLFDNQTILFGDAASIFATLDRNQFGPPPLQSAPAPGSIMARAAEMEANYDFWAIMDATEILSNDSVAALFRGGEWVTEAQGFEVGITLRSGLAADISVRLSSDAAAKRMTSELTRMINLAAKDKNAGGQMQEIAKKLKLVADGSAARISLRMTQQEVEKSAQAFAAARRTPPQLGGKPGWSPTPAAAPPPVPAPAKPGVIRIDGLDDGPREIPYPAPQP